MRKIIFVLLLSSFCCASCSASDLPPEWSGVYPHLASFNTSGECGTGAVVPWAGKLWTITYSPHRPKGSDDKIYEIDEYLNMTIRPESIGGTPANRMIHRESKQLFIGPYAIDRKGNVRVIPYTEMPGRHTGTARHLSDPAGKIYYATMEEGFYEVDVKTLEVHRLYQDGNDTKNMGGDLLPGYHGKGLYSGQGRLVYANNGENSPLAKRKPDIPSGCLAEWDGKEWNVVRRNQFTEVTGPGGIFGNSNPATDPIWSMGWDNRSLILMLLDGGKWHSFRLPKASHSYDGAHGWNTEWPRIREIGEKDLLMTMHGMFWRFPETFSSKDTSGISPRSSYLAVVADFCKWKQDIVWACDVTAEREFLNKRKAKGEVAGPGQSQSNVRFINPDQLDKLGTSIGRGAVWLNDPVDRSDVSDPFLFAGFDNRGVHLAHDNKETVKFTFETDIKGDGKWSVLKTVKVDASGYKWISFSPSDKGQWIRIRLDRDCAKATAYFQYSDEYCDAGNDDIFDGLVTAECKNASGGLVRARGENLRTLHFAAVGTPKGKLEDIGYYEIDVDMKLRRVDDPKTHKWLKGNVAVPQGVLSFDAASALYVDEEGKRYRLPKGDASFDRPGVLGLERVDREVCTERDVFNCHGTFYELPAENAGGFSKIRPITTHNRHVTDYCSWRGLLVMTGIATDSPQDNKHIIRSDDGKCAIWVGAVDDLWRLGKAKGRGGPWKDTSVRAGQPSDPYLMTGYDRKSLTLSHKNKKTITISVEVDIDGNGNWKPYRSFEVTGGKPVRYEFPDAFGAYWLRVTSSQDVVATAQLVYE